MQKIVHRLLEDFERGRLTRRQFVQRVAAAAAIAAAPTTAGAAGGFRAITLDHISFQVSDYRKTRDFYSDLLGMRPSRDNGVSECELNFGESILLARSRSQRSGTDAQVNHIAYRIADWNTDRVKAELESRGFKPRLDTGPSDMRNYASFHIPDPDGFDVQISGVVQPGDSLYK